MNESNFSIFSWSFNDSSTKPLLTLQDLNDEEVMRRLPSLIYMAVLIVVGVPGNLSVLVIFYRYYKETTYRTFVLALASVDLVACTVCMPFEVIETRYQYTFYAVTICKLFRTNNIVISVSSIFILICLSADRYRHVCNPLKRQMTVKTAKIACVVSALAAVMVAWPNFLFSGTRHVELRSNLTGIDCSMSDEYRKSKLPFYHSALLLLIFIIAILTIIILYILIGAKVWKHSNFRKAFQNSRSASYSTSSTSVGGSKRSKHQDCKDQQYPLQQIEIKQSDQNKGSNAASMKKKDNSNSSPKETQQTSRITKVAFAISVLFILSYLPHLILTIMTAIKGSFIAKPGPVVSAILPIVTRSVFINSVGNPFIYGFIDKRFWNFLKKMLTCK
ncbi:hypothetical protein FSP39_022219 [Pinctada imbricata]|uniref:G-protein coupled receptors family 1 profile domain-containing protein n=1 Tax=Pinctada imbricata TaxID=66713 RepID=A0AA88YFG7_PINIB|nr:hypothetical protein FSP39_022219 [Pinctada imbricata]